MRILLLGKNGQLGWELHRALAPLGDILALDYPEIDLSKPESVREHIREFEPAVIFNATAYTAVDRADSETGLAFAINEAAPSVLADEACALGAALFHYSTDYVFDGTKGEPYIEQDAPKPINAYGRSKLAGEQAVSAICDAAGGAYLILRTSWVYSTRQGGFVNKVLNWARSNPELRVVADQVGNPTWCRMLAETSAQLLSRAGGEPYAWIKARAGLYHLAGAGKASRLEWARLILSLDPNPQEQRAKEILPAKTADFPTPATRPLFSALNSDLFKNTFGLTLPPWETALRLAMEMP